MLLFPSAWRVFITHFRDEIIRQMVLIIQGNALVVNTNSDLVSLILGLPLSREVKQLGSWGTFTLGTALSSLRWLPVSVDRNLTLRTSWPEFPLGRATFSFRILSVLDSSAPEAVHWVCSSLGSQLSWDARDGPFTLSALTGLGSGRLGPFAVQVASPPVLHLGDCFCRVAGFLPVSCCLVWVTGFSNWVREVCTEESEHREMWVLGANFGD
jgi:hypothetical protein